MTTQRVTFSFMLILILMLSFGQAAVQAAVSSASQRSFDIKWLDTGDEPNIQQLARDPRGWTNVTSLAPPPRNAADNNSFLVRITLPELANGSGILFDGLSGLRFKLLKHGIVLYDYSAPGLYPYHRILVPLHASDSGQTLYLIGKTDNHDVGLGIGTAPLIGPYDELSSRYTRADLPSITLGMTLLFVGAVMLICSIFLTREQLSNWLSLSVIVMTISILIVLRCPFPYLFFSDYAALYGIVADVALYVCLPVSVYFFEQLLGSRWEKAVRYWRYFVMFYSALSIVGSLINVWTDGRITYEYMFLTGGTKAIIIVLTVTVISAHCMRSAWERNKEALIICFGITGALAMATIEFSWLCEKYGPASFFIWEWPLTGFVFHLIVLLSKRYVKEHAQAASYLRELELYQKQLMESTQIEAASQLAASVAHEVRNPLTVTRGFLQLLRHRTAEEAEPLQEALQELDHAHDVITNYLKYAKPEADDIDLLNVQELLKETVVILRPLLIAQGVSIDCQSEEALLIRGRASQLKQALITILKQRIYSSARHGQIAMQAYEEEGHAVIRITDEAKPFITTSFLMPDVPLANRMTDAGLFFALRSIEAMDGKLVVKKRRGGSQLIIRLPVTRAS